MIDLKKILNQLLELKKTISEKQGNPVADKLLQLKQIVAQDLKKDVWEHGQDKVHGWISPEGEYHPAVQTSRNLFSDSSGENVEIGHDDTDDVNTVSLNHWVKHGTIPKKGSVAEFHKSLNRLPMGWISPKGKFHTSETHHKFASKIKPKSLNAAKEMYEEGWISTGHGGLSDVNIHSKFLNDFNHPAIKALSKLVSGSDALNINVGHADSDKWYRVPYSMASKGNFNEPGKLQQFHKTELQKDVWGQGQDKVHGWISPEGEYHHMKFNEMHGEVADKLHASYENGWLSLGHAGGLNVQGKKHFLENPDHPAVKTARRILAQHFPDHSVLISAQHEGKSSPDLNVVPVNHWSKYGTIPAKGSVAEFHKSELKKEMWNRIPEDIQTAHQYHGWIDPKGKFYRMPSQMSHREFARKQVDRMKAYSNHEPEDVLTKMGWLRSGLSGTKSVSGTSEVLHDPSHPATKKFAELIRDVNPDKHVDVFTENDMYHVPHHLAIRGNFKKPSIVAEFHKAVLNKTVSFKGKPQSIGYNSHGHWAPLHEIKYIEAEERGNPWPLSDKYDQTHEAIWVNHKSTRSTEERYGGQKQINLKGAKPVLSDQEGGYLYIRPKRSLVKRQLDPKLGYKIFTDVHNKHGITVMAKDPHGNNVGEADIMFLSPGNEMVAHTVRVHSEHRRKGLATAMYQHAEKETGRKMKPASARSREGTSLWAQPKRPFGRLNKADNKLHLEHYSNEKHDIIDPGKHGTGVKGEEGKFIGDVNYQPRSYHYVAGSKPERLLAGKKYKHTSSVDANKIYDIDTDVHNFYDKAKASSPYAAGVFHPPTFERHIKDAGYHGYRKGNVVAVFVPLKPHKVEENIKPLSKVAFGRKEAQKEAHGWIDPKGKYYRMSPDQGHEHFFYFNKQHNISSPSEAHEKGWLSIGHGGYSNIQGHSKYLDDTTHPATRKAKELAGRHFVNGDLLTLHYSDKEGYEALPSADHIGAINISLNHWIKHGTVPKSLVAQYHTEDFEKSNLKKEMWGLSKYPEHLAQMRQFHGVMSPEGKFHLLGDTKYHYRSVAARSKMPRDKAYKRGWTEVGLGGFPSIGGHSTILHDPSHPVVREIARKVKALPDHIEHISVNLYDDDKIDSPRHYNVPRHLAERGNFKPPSIVAEFHKAMPVKSPKAPKVNAPTTEPVAPKEPEPPLTVKGTPISPNPQIKNNVKSQFDEQTGTLHTPRGSFNIVLPQTDTQKKDLFGSTSASEYDKIITSPDVQRIHEKATNNWLRLHKLMKEGQLPDSLIAHSVIFTILSANNAVPAQELMYSRLVDQMNEHGVDPSKVSFAELMGRGNKLREGWRGSDSPTQLPKHAHEFWAGPGRESITQKSPSELTGRKAGDIYKLQFMDAASDKLIHYPALHGYLRDLVSQHRQDTQGAISQMMRDKVAGKHPLDLPAGMGSKIGRYFYSMLGGSNSIVPDTHLVRHLFGLDNSTDSDTHKYLKQVLWNPQNHELLNGIDRFYGEHYPTVKYVQDKYFKGEKTPDAIFPAFWLHWLSIAPHEKFTGMRSHAKQERAGHEPYWQMADQILKAHGLGEMKKTEEDVPIEFRTASAMYDLTRKIGPTAANLVFYSHIVPHFFKEAMRDKVGGFLHRQKYHTNIAKTEKTTCHYLKLKQMYEN